MFDVFIIGGGPGGYAAAIRAAQLGLKTALAEKADIGGVCLNRGCIPTKSLLHAAGVMRSIKEAKQYGLKAESAQLDFRKVLANKNEQVKTLTAGIKHLLHKNGVEIFYGQADLVTPNSVDIDGKRVACRNIVIAVGSSPARPKIPGLEGANVLTSDEALFLEDIPESLAIIGGGVVGVEMAFIFKSFGCETRVIELEHSLVPIMDADICKGLEKLLKNHGVQILTGAKVQEVLTDALLCTSANESVRIPAQKVLVATGRSSNGLGLSLDRLGIAHKNGVIQTDALLRTNLPNVFAIGDVNGKYLLAHVATAEGLRAVENIAGVARPMDYSAVPQCIYTEPEAASVGLSEAEAVSRGLDIKTSLIPALANGKSLIEGCRDGFAKIVCEKASGRVLGVHLLLPHASEMLTQCTAAIRYRATAKELLEVIYPHPSVSELIHEGLHGIVDRPIHY